MNLLKVSGSLNNRLPEPIRPQISEKGLASEIPINGILSIDIPIMINDKKINGNLNLPV
jgi:hypothetical protein